MTKLIGVMFLIISISLASCAPLFFIGAGAAAGIAGYKFYHGALNVIYEAPFEKTWNATLKALRDMNIKVTASNHDLTTGKISGLYPDKTPVNISLKYKTSKETEAIIRVGPLGNEAASENIKEAIRKVLFGP